MTPKIHVKSTAKRFLFAFAFFFTFNFTSNAQTSAEITAKLDSLSAQLSWDSTYIYRFRKWRPYVNYIERLSLGNPRTVNFLGPKLGVVYNERHIFALGAFFSSEFTKREKKVTDENQVVNEKLKLTYGTFSYEIILIKRKYFEFPLPFEFGYGNNHSTYANENTGVIYKTMNNNFILFSSGFLMRLKLTKYLGIIGAMGYRVSNQRVITGFYYSYGVWVGLRKISNACKLHKKKKEYRRQVKHFTSSKV